MLVMASKAQSKDYGQGYALAQGLRHGIQVEAKFVSVASHRVEPQGCH